jgi:transketolase
MSAIQQLQTLHVFTHDSFYLGEDGPTHQPIEHVMSLRLIPELLVLRPADAHETKACLELFLSNQHRPSLIALTRQNLPNFEAADKINQGVKQGGYIIYESENWDNDAVIFASGSEVSLAIDAAKLVESEAAMKVRIVSLPCWELFFEQSEDYIEEIMSKNARLKVSIEAGVTTGWQKFTSNDGLNIGIDHFGESAPHQALAEKYGFTPSAVAHKILQHYKQKA